MYLSIKSVATCSLFAVMLSIAQDARARDCSSREVYDTCSDAPPPTWIDGKCYGHVCSMEYVAGCKDCVVECHGWGCPNPYCSSYTFSVCDPTTCSSGGP